MSKIRTKLMLQDYLDGEFAWRLKEIASIKVHVSNSQPPIQNTVIRAGLALLYAHWEGFVKNSSEGYINFVNNQKLPCNKLASCFVVFGVKSYLNDLSNTLKSQINIAAVDFFFNKLADRATLDLASAINTKSNLASHVFENIVLSIGLNPSPYKTKYNLIDISLLARRNKIAHGEYLDVAAEDYRSLADNVIALMRDFKTDIENASILEHYRR